MIRGSAGCLGIDPTKTKLGQIEFFDEDIDHANRIVLADPVFQAFRKQRGLTAIDPLNEAPHPILPQIARESYRGNQSRRCVFTQAGSTADYTRVFISGLQQVVAKPSPKSGPQERELALR